jgi:hypothetical protein
MRMAPHGVYSAGKCYGIPEGGAPRFLLAAGIVGYLTSAKKDRINDLRKLRSEANRSKINSSFK